MTSTKLWYLLVDSATGQPYDCTTADVVSLPRYAVVAQFRDAVYIENSSILTDIAPSQLLVYKNKAAFDARNNAKDQGKEQPLNPTEAIGMLGSTEDMLVVVVPPLSQPPYQQTSQTQSFRPCGFSFFNSICNVTERHGCISFGQERMPCTSLNSLYIRKCYRTIASSILEVNGIHKAIITGTPGIGKSLFLIYLLWRLVKEGKRVLFLYCSFNIYYDGNGGVFSFSRTNLPLDNDYSFWNDTLWCLFDDRSRKEFDLIHLPVELSTFIVTSSPRGDMVNDFKKPPVPQVFYMPTWTKAELEAIAPLFPNANNEWRGRFTILGGIPRYLWEVTTQTPTAILKEVSMYCSLDDCIEEISLDSINKDTSNAIYFLVHITSIPPFTESSMCYASPTALNIIVQHKAFEATLKIQDLLPSCEENPLAAALYRHIFEQYAIKLLERGGTFTCRQLVGGNTELQPIESTLDILPSKKVVVDRVLPNQTLNQLHVPKTKSHAAIDAWIPGIGAFQMTVGKKHNIKGGARDDLAKLGGSNKLYWLLPPLYYHAFTKKAPYDIKQYAIWIPYPKSRDCYVFC